MSSRTLINAAVFACAIAVTGTSPDALYAQWDDPHSTTRIIVTPKETEVFVDGYFVGIADDFDGVFQGLRLDPGPHEITLFLNGHRTVHQRLNLSAGASYKVRHTMVANAAGEAQETRPVPPRPRESRQAGHLSICVQPAAAEVWIDGERWETPGDQDRLEVAVPGGEHIIEVRKEGYRTYRSTIVVPPGETVPLNISLPRSTP